MLYEQYEEKIQKIAKVTNFIHRFRFLFGGILTAILAFVISFLSLKGIVKDVAPIEATFQYGQKLSYDSKASLGGDVTYEFSNYPGNDWTTEEPETVGIYQMRAVSHNGFGMRKEGEAHVFEIKPVETTITITSDYISYGDEPSLSVDLIGTDSLSNVRFSVDDIRLARPNYSVNLNELKVLSRDGQDRTSCYHFTSESKEVSIVPRKISLQYFGYEKEYDGTNSPTKAQYELMDGTSLAPGDSFDDSDAYYPGYQDVGQYLCSETNIKIRNPDGIDVTNHYQIRSESPLIQINKRPITVESESFTKNYDGRPISHEVVKTVGNLVSGHRLNLQWNYAEQIKKGSTENRFLCQVLDENGIDVSMNYDLTYRYGTLRVDPLPIQVYTKGITLYDSKDLNYDYPDEEVHVNGLENSCHINGETVKVEMKSKRSNGVTVPSLSVDVVDTDGVSTKDNYLITLNPSLSDSNIQIIKHKVVIEVSSLEVIYDGQDHEQNDFTVEIDDTYRYAELPQIGTDRLSCGSFPKIHDVGEIANTTSFTVLDSTGNDVSEYYDITVKPGTLKVNPRPLNIHLPRSSYIYDGLSHSFSNSDFTTSGDGSVESGLLDNHTLSVSSECTKSIVTPKESFSIVNGNPSNGEVGFDYHIYDDQNKDVTSDYSATILMDEEGSSLRIGKRKLSLSFNTDTITKWEDGRNFNLNALEDYVVSGPTDDTKGEGLVTGDSLSFESKELNLNNYQKYSIDGVYGLSNIKVKRGNLDVTDCYDITLSSLPQIDYRRVRLSFHSEMSDHEYDSVVYTEPTGQVTLNEDLSDYPDFPYMLQYDFSASGMRPGDYPLVQNQLRIVEPDGYILTPEYMDWGFDDSSDTSFTISKPSLSVIVPSCLSWYRKDVQNSASDFNPQVRSGNLKGSDRLVVKTKNGKTIPQETGEFAMSDFLDVFVYRGNEDVTDCYDFSKSFGIFFYKKISVSLSYVLSHPTQKHTYNDEDYTIDYSMSGFKAENDDLTSCRTNEERYRSMTRPDGTSVSVAIDADSEKGLKVGSYMIKLQDVTVTDGYTYRATNKEIDLTYDASDLPDMTIGKKTLGDITFSRSKSKICDGRTVTFDPGASETNTTVSYYNDLNYEQGNLAGNDVLTLVLKNGKTAFKDAGTYSLNDYFEVRIINNITKDDRTDQYEFSLDLGSITISKLAVNFSIDSPTTPWYLADDYTPSITQTILNGSEFEADELAKVTLTPHYTTDDNASKIGSHLYTLSSVDFEYDWIYCFTQNFTLSQPDYLDITTNTGTRTLTKARLNLTLSDKTFALYELGSYDYQTSEIQATSPDTDISSLFIFVSLFKIPTALGTYDQNTLQYSVMITDGLGVNYSDRFLVSVVTAHVTVEKPSFVAKLDNSVIYYDGTEHTPPGKLISASDFVYNLADFTFNFSVSCSMAGDYTEFNSSSGRLVSIQTQHVYSADEFNLTLENGNHFLIQKKEVTVSLKNLMIEYDGEDHIGDIQGALTTKSLAGGDDLDANLMVTLDSLPCSEVIEVGVYTIVLMDYTIRNSKGVDVTECYVVSGKFTATLSVYTW